MGRAVWLLSLLYASGCVTTTSNVCDNGSLCPGGFVCDVENDRCLVPEQISACESLGELDECTFNGALGACHAGACEVYHCGDGIVSLGEDCDGENLNGADCKDFPYYGVEGLACSSSCTFDTEGCKIHAYCGDGEVNGPELCDGPENRTCMAMGFDAGTATCNKTCAFSINDCSRFGWNPESLGNVAALAIAGTASNDQWAFGADGRAMHYEGVFWNTVPTNVQNNLIRGWSNAPDDTWAIGESRASGPTLSSVVLRWDGLSWITIAGVPAATEYVDVWGTTTPRATYVASSSGAGIFKYDGTNWTTLPAFTGEPIAIRGTSASDIWVATLGGPLMHFNGTSWQDRSPTGATIKFLDANTPSDVWAIGHANANQGTGIVAHWNGSTWTQFVRPQEIYNAVASSAPNDAWVAGVDGLMRHWDGLAWSRSVNIGASPSGLSSLSGLISLGSNELVAVSTLNLAYRYRGQTFGTLPSLGSNPFDAPENTSMWTPSTKHTYVANVKGELWRYDNVMWTLLYTVPGGPFAIRDVFGTSLTNIWLVDSNGTVTHFDGTIGTPYAVTPDIVLERVWTDGTEVWAFGATGAYRKNGTQWTRHRFTDRRVLSVSGTSASDLYAVEEADGGPSKLWHWDGAAWAEVTTNASLPMLAVAALAPDNVHVTAESGRMLHFNGTAWSESVIPVLANLTFITATAPDDVIAASERDLAHFNGESWSTMRTPVEFVPNQSDYLPIVDLAAAPGRIDFLHSKFRLRTLIRTRPLVCRIRETCGDAVDNDCDNMVDAIDVGECP